MFHMLYRFCEEESDSHMFFTSTISSNKTDSKTQMLQVTFTL